MSQGSRFFKKAQSLSISEETFQAVKLELAQLKQENESLRKSNSQTRLFELQTDLAFALEREHSKQEIIDKLQAEVKTEKTMVSLLVAQLRECNSLLRIVEAKMQASYSKELTKRDFGLDLKV